MANGNFCYRCDCADFYWTKETSRTRQRSLGKSIREFQRAKDDVMTKINEETDDVKSSITENPIPTTDQEKTTSVEASTQSEEKKKTCPKRSKSLLLFFSFPYNHP